MSVIHFPSGKREKQEKKQGRTSEGTLEDLNPVRVQECLLEVESEKARTGLVLRIVQKLEEEMLGELAQSEERWLLAVAEVQRLLGRCNTAIKSILECDETLQHAVLGGGPMWWRVGRLQDRIEQLSGVLASAENGVRSEWRIAANGLKEFSDLVREFEADLPDYKDAA